MKNQVTKQEASGVSYEVLKEDSQGDFRVILRGKEFGREVDKKKLIQSLKKRYDKVGIYIIIVGQKSFSHIVREKITI